MNESPAQAQPHAEDEEQIPDEEEEEEVVAAAQNMRTQNAQRCRCDFCGEREALLYCRADSAKLCFSCDREVHSTNQLFTKHTRSLLCNACDSCPSSILCSSENMVLCQNCDWEKHNRSLSLLHERRLLEGYSGCPSAAELLSIVGFDDVGDKALLLDDEGGAGGDGFLEDGFSDFLVWDTPSVVSLDDLMTVSADSDHNFQAMGVPSLPKVKNRNAACGQHKEELLHQLRELSRLEPGLNSGHGRVESLIGFESMVHEQALQLGNAHDGCEHNAEATAFPAYEASAFNWRSDGGEAANQVCLPSTLLRSRTEESPENSNKHSVTICSVSNVSGSDEGQLRHPIISRTSSVPSSGLTKAAPHEVTSQDRETAISRYKEKKKARRYDKHVRYESRKVRAETRTRIRGRFAKAECPNSNMQPRE
ncbi:zinc finger protein CONSTANS-LIKE 13 isoform X2 [Malania oleifera]|uniref:zinc finger protein CONSTANS-LIKE 13 isoform X2 n=1 Tax=Malania oleifera TaxID=397392 RepID=UPI0025AEC2A4|nr:zinc finger protein CONSTANS-LIKE 13 isoform X2 [Malania oleifera]